MAKNLTISAIIVIVLVVVTFFIRRTKECAVTYSFLAMLFRTDYFCWCRALVVATESVRYRRNSRVYLVTTSHCLIR